MNTLTVGGDAVRFRVTSEQSSGTLVAIDVRMQPGGGPPMLHRHAPTELYRVDEGELTFYVEDADGIVRRTSARAGDVICIPARREHTIRNESPEPARALVVFSPGRPMERFARDAAALSAPRSDDVLALAAANGIEITRPVTEVDR